MTPWNGAHSRGGYPDGGGGVSVPSLDELKSEPGWEYIGPLADRRQARDWGLVLASQGIEHALTYSLDGWVLRVPAVDGARARRSIDTYVEENRDWPPVEKRDVPRHAPSFAVAMAFSLLGVFFAVTGPAAHASAWFSRGSADAHLLFHEPWRMVTALTLHADSQHVLGNIISGGIFGSTVSRRLGPGGALLAIVSAGAVGNGANALAHLGGGHLSIGASTAVFAAIGILAGFQAVLTLIRRHEPRRRKLRAIDVAAPVAGGLALLGSLGAGGANTDLGAHGFGFLAGLGVGAGLSFAMRRSHAQDGARPSRALQLALGSAAVLLVSGSWALAMLGA